MHRTNLIFPCDICICVYVSEIVSHFGLQIDSDFQNMIYKNFDRSERSVNVRVSSQQLNTEDGHCRETSVTSFFGEPVHFF
jgi:hypothetical protein